MPLMLLCSLAGRLLDRVLTWIQLEPVLELHWWSCLLGRCMYENKYMHMQITTDFFSPTEEKTKVKKIKYNKLIACQ